MKTAYVPHWISYLVEAGRLAPSADNSQPWRFVFDGQRLALEFDETRGGELGSDHPAVLMAFGTVIENLVQAAQHADMDTHSWEFLIPTNGQRCFLKIPAPTRDLEAVEIPKTSRKRHTNRGKFARTPLSNEIISEIAQHQEGDIRVLVFSDPTAIRRLARLIRFASELRFQTKEVHRWLAQSLRFTETEIARGDGLDVNTLNLPPGGKALSKFLADWRRMAWLNRFGAYKFLAWVEAAQFTQAGAGVAIVGQDRGNAAWLNAGRLLERLWLSLNAHNLAVHPYFVLADQLHRLETGHPPPSLRLDAERLTQQTREFFDSSDETLFMLLRVGKAKKPVRRSRRLPLGTILVLKR
ncbi:MAG: nitroreductase family protein [Methylohalobius sp. ZOD2]